MAHLPRWRFLLVKINKTFSRQNVHASSTKKALETLISFRRLVATDTAPEGKEQLLRGKDTKRERMRGLMRRPIPRMKDLPPALQMRSATDRALACRWHLGTFPIQSRFLCNIGLQNYLEDLKLLTKKKTSPIESMKLRLALRVISSIPEQEHPTVNQEWPFYDLRLAAYLPRWRFLPV